MGYELQAAQRMLPIVHANSMMSGKSRTVNSRTFTATAGTTVDAAQQDARVLQANNWFNVGGPDCVGVGTTAQRPTTGLMPRSTYVDTTLGYIIIFDGTTWRNPVTGASV